MGWRCRLVGKLSGKSAFVGNDFVLAGKRTSCDVLFIVVECTTHRIFSTLSIKNVFLTHSRPALRSAKARDFRTNLIDCRFSRSGIDDRVLESIPADHSLIHCYQLLHFAVVRGLVITVRFGSSLDQNPVLPAVSLELLLIGKRQKCLENGFPAISFSKFSGVGPGPPPWASRLRDARGRPAPPPPLRRLRPSLVGKASPYPLPQIDFTLYAYACRCVEWYLPSTSHAT